MSLVELTTVVKRYGANTVLDRVSLAVEPGEIIAVIGRSGSGKSTMLRCINGLEPIQEGRIVFDGTVVNDPATDLRKLRQRVGIVFQSYNLFPPDDEPHELLYTVLHQAPPRPRVMNGRISDRLEAVLLRLLAKEPGDRYGTAIELLESLRALDPPSVASSNVGPPTANPEILNG